MRSSKWKRMGRSMDLTTELHKTLRCSCDIAKGDRGSTIDVPRSTSRESHRSASKKECSWTSEWPKQEINQWSQNGYRASQNVWFTQPLVCLIQPYGRTVGPPLSDVVDMVSRFLGLRLFMVTTFTCWNHLMSFRGTSPWFWIICDLGCSLILWAENCNSGLKIVSPASVATLWTSKPWSIRSIASCGWWNPVTQYAWTHGIASLVATSWGRERELRSPMNHEVLSSPKEDWMMLSLQWLVHPRKQLFSKQTRSTSPNQPLKSLSQTSPVCTSPRNCFNQPAFDHQWYPMVRTGC